MSVNNGNYERPGLTGPGLRLAGHFILELLVKASQTGNTKIVNLPTINSIENSFYGKIIVVFKPQDYEKMQTIPEGLRHPSSGLIMTVIMIMSACWTRSAQ